MHGRSPPPSESIAPFLGRHARGIRLLAVGLAVIGYALCATVLIGHGTAPNGGGGADAFAYWTAGGNLLAGRPVYGNGVGAYEAFLYPSPLAQVFAPLASLPFPAALWIWRGVLLACLRVAAGSWVRAGIALLVFPPDIAEMDVGNVHLVLAAGVALAIRGRPEGLPATALTKFASLAALPMAAAHHPRRLAIGIGVAAVIAAASFFISPELWLAYPKFLSAMPPEQTGWYDLGRGIPTALRLWAAALVAIAAIRWPRLAAVAATLALPVVWFSGLSVLTAALATPEAWWATSPNRDGQSEATSDLPG